MSGGVFLLSYTPSWHRKRQLYLYMKNISLVLPSDCMLLLGSLKSPVILYNGVKRTAERSRVSHGLSCIFFHGTRALVDLGHLIVETSVTHSETPHSVRLLWTSDWPVAETSA